MTAQPTLVPPVDPRRVVSVEQVDELERLARRIVLRSVLIDYTFLQGEDLGLQDPFAGDYTVAEAIQELVDDIRVAADGIQAVMRQTTVPQSDGEA